MVLVFLPLVRVTKEIVFKGKLPILSEGDQKKQTDRLGEAKVCIPCHSLLSLYRLCDSDELWM